MWLSCVFRNLWSILALLLILTSSPLCAVDYGHVEPLFLTPYIQDGLLGEARNLSEVGVIDGMDETISYSGYLTVNATHNSSLFFWFFPAQANSDAAPVILWLDGGPGTSSLYGLFQQIGPFQIYSENGGLDPILTANYYSWNTYYNILFIDNPVGTGYSFTDEDKGYARNMDDVSRDLDNGLRQFFTIFTEHVRSDFYIAGTTFAGKYISTLGHRIHLNNPTEVPQISLKGVAIGNGLIDPIEQMRHDDYLYELGLIDQSQRAFFKKVQEQIKANTEMGQMAEAFAAYDQLFLGVMYPYPTYFTNVTGLRALNLLLTDQPATYFKTYAKQPEVRRAIHVGGRKFQDGAVVRTMLIDDFMSSSKPSLEFLIDNDYKVMLYCGQLDLGLPYAGNIRLIANLTGKMVDDYRAAPRHIWKVDPQDTEVAGYVRPINNLVEVLVRNAGHQVAEDAPRVALDLINRFIDGSPWRT